MPHIQILLILTSLLPFCAQAQVDTTVTLEALEVCVRERFARSLDADLAALEYSTKGEWLKYLPNLGVTYTVAGEPRPAISTSTSVLYQARRDKKTRVAARDAARQRNAIELDQELAQLRRLWIRYQAAARRSRVQDDIAIIDKELFKLYEKQYANKEILPEEFLLKKKGFLIQELHREEESQKVFDTWFDLTKTAGCLKLN